jgi:hypothetical protein
MQQIDVDLPVDPVYDTIERRVPKLRIGQYIEHPFDAVVDNLVGVCPLGPVISAELVVDEAVELVDKMYRPFGYRLWS